MIDLKELKGLMSKTLDEMGTCQRELARAEDGGDETERAAALTRHETLKAEFDRYELRAKTAQDHARRAQVVKSVAALAEPAHDTAWPSLATAAVPVDTDLAQREHERLFVDWLQGKTLGDAALARLQPRNPKFVQARGGVVMPQCFSRAILGLSAKAVAPFTSDEATALPLTDDEFKPEVLALPPEPGHLFFRVRRVSAAAGQVLYPKLTQTDADEFGGVAVQWTAEGADKTYVEPAFEQLAIPTNELSAQTQISRTLLGRSAINLEEFMGNEFRAAIMNTLDQAFINGDGVGKPLGVLQEAGVDEVNRQVAADVDYDDLVNLEHSLRAHHRRNAIWLLADGAMQALKKKRDADGRPLFVPNPSTGAYNTLLGYPVVTTHRLTLGSTGDVIFADFSQYIAPVEQDIVLQRSEHRHMEKGVVLFVVFMLVGGKVAQSRAFAKLGPV